MGGRFTFHRLMAQNGFEAMTDAKFKSTLSRLLSITAREVDVLKWHRALPEKQQADWHHPNTVFVHCPLFKKPERTEEEEAAAKARKIAAAQKLLGLKPGAPVPQAADWVPAGIGAKPSAEAMAAKQAANAEAEAAEVEEGLDYMNAFAGIDAVKNEAEPAEFVAAMRDLAAGDADKMATLSAKIDGLLVYFDKVKLALAAPPPRPKRGGGKGGKGGNGNKKTGTAKGEPKPTETKKAGKGEVASAAKPGEAKDADFDPRLDHDYDDKDPFWQSERGKWLQRQAAKRLSDPAKRKQAEATTAGLLGAAYAAAGVEPEGETAKADEPEAKVQWSETDDGKWTAVQDGYTFEVAMEGWGGKGFYITYKTPAGETFFLKPPRKPRSLERAKAIAEARMARIASGDFSD
jgi:hypothetical protein